MKTRWPGADDPLTTFGQVLFFPGIGDHELLERVSKLGGEYDRPQTSTSQGSQEQANGQKSTTENTTTSTVKTRNYPPETISQGLDPQDPRLVICLQGGKLVRLEVSPYFESPPWSQVLALYVHAGVTGAVPPWTRSVDDPPPEGFVRGLPLPNLRDWAVRNYGVREAYPWTYEWAQRYIHAARLEHLVPEPRRGHPVSTVADIAAVGCARNWALMRSTTPMWTRDRVVGAMNPQARHMVECGEMPPQPEWEIAMSRLKAEDDRRSEQELRAFYQKMGREYPPRL